VSGRLTGCFGGASFDPDDERNRSSREVAKGGRLSSTRRRAALRRALAVVSGVPRSAAVVFAAAALLAGACGDKGREADEEEERPASAAPRVVAGREATVVALDAATRERAGVVVETLSAATHQAEETAYGTVLDLTGLAEGRGAVVAAGARADKARAALAASKAEYERVKALSADDHNASERNVERATAAWSADEAELHAAEAALAGHLGADRERWGATIAGWIAGGSTELEVLLQQKERLLQITLPPGSPLGFPPPTATVRAGDGAGVAARFVSPAPRTDPSIQGASFLYAAPAAPALLPGASVVARLRGGPAWSGVVVPEASVVWWQGLAWVYVEMGPGRYVRRGVATDTPVPGGWFVTTGVAAGERVVVRGAQVLLSEEGRAAVHGSEG